MKNVLRSTAGKTLLFILCNLAVFTAFGSLAILLYPEASAPQIITALFPPAAH